MGNERIYVVKAYIGRKSGNINNWIIHITHAVM